LNVLSTNGVEAERVWQAEPVRPSGVAFLLAQIGAHAANRFAGRVAALGLTPAQVGVLRVVAQRPGLSQQALATELGVVPSKVVSLVDALEERGVLERRRDPADRRLYALHLSESAQELLRRVRDTVRQHDQELTSALTPDERGQLAALLGRIADAQGLTPGVHPGYRDPPPGRPAT
jgi:DNA-binding MarR family transcriptional regulator